MESENFQLTPKQISHLAASMLLVGFFIFVSGYYLGKKNGINSMTEQFEETAMIDKMNNALCSLSEIGISEEAEELMSLDETKNNQQSSKVVSGNKSLYYAQIAGFGTLKAAEECEKNLALRGFAVKTVERKGPKRNWYQVITYAESDKEKLIQQVEQIKKIAHIKDIVISVTNKEN